MQIDKHIASWRERVDRLVNSGISRGQIADKANINPTAFRKLIRVDLDDILADKKGIYKKTYKEIELAITYFERKIK